MPAKKTASPQPTAQLVAMRKRLGLNQTDFWTRIGVSQSCGSRFESGRTGIPQPVQMLLDLVYFRTPAKAQALLNQLRGDSK